MATTTQPWFPPVLERRGDPVVLAAVASVPRELFGRLRPLSAITAMVEALDIGPDDRVLEIGTGTGFTAALLSMLAAHVYTIEPDPALAEETRDRLDALGYDWINLRCDDGEQGWAVHAPYDAILVHAAAAELPQALVDQLAIGGRLVMPIGRGATPRLVRATKLRPAECALDELGPLPAL